MISGLKSPNHTMDDRITNFHQRLLSVISTSKKAKSKYVQHVRIVWAVIVYSLESLIHLFLNHLLIYTASKVKHRLNIF